MTEIKVTFNIEEGMTYWRFDDGLILKINILEICSILDRYDFEERPITEYPIYETTSIWNLNSHKGHITAHCIDDDNILHIAFKFLNEEILGLDIPKYDSFMDILRQGVHEYTKYAASLALKN